MINHPETGVKTMEEMGSPMKLAVTLHRQYTPTPEPTPEEIAAKEAAKAAAEAKLNETVEDTVEEATEVAEEEPAAEVEVVEEELVAEAEAVEEEPAVEVEAVEEEPAVEVEAVEEEPAAEVEAVEEEPAVEVEAVEEEPVAEVEAAEEKPAAEVEAVEEEPVAEAEAAEEEPAADEASLFSANYVDNGGKETIFAEIFNAVEEAHAAPVIEAEPVKEVKRKARYLFLIPYVIFAVAIGIPATLVFGVANLAVLSATLVSLGGAVYLALFGIAATVGLSSKLIVFGLTILMVALTISLGVMTVWFLRTATIGFPRFLFEVARTHGYREVEVQ